MFVEAVSLNENQRNTQDDLMKQPLMNSLVSFDFMIVGLCEPNVPCLKLQSQRRHSNLIKRQLFPSLSFFFSRLILNTHHVQLYNLHISHCCAFTHQCCSQSSEHISINVTDVPGYDGTSVKSSIGPFHICCTLKEASVLEQQPWAQILPLKL